MKLTRNFIYIFFLLSVFFLGKNSYAESLCECWKDDLKCVGALQSCGDGWKKFEASGVMPTCAFTDGNGNYNECNASHHGYSAKCCIKEDLDYCPVPSFCSAEDLFAEGYRIVPAIDHCTTVDPITNKQVTGKCWLLWENEAFDECIPYPSACDSTPSLSNPVGCSEGDICVYKTDETGSRYVCAVDTENVCGTCVSVLGGTCLENCESSCTSGSCTTEGGCYSGSKCCTPNEYTCVPLGGFCEPQCKDCGDGYSCSDDGTCPGATHCCLPDGSNTCTLGGGTCVSDCAAECTAFSKVCGAQNGCPSGQYCCKGSSGECSGACRDTSCALGETPSLTENCDSLGPGYVCCITVITPPLPEPNPKDPFINTIYKGPAIDDLSKLLGPVAKVLYYGGLAIGIFFIILSGYNLMTSGGNPQKTQSAQEQLTAAIIGIMFILLSSTILRIVVDEIIGL